MLEPTKPETYYATKRPFITQKSVPVGLSPHKDFHMKCDQRSRHRTYHTVTLTF